MHIIIHLKILLQKVI